MTAKEFNALEDGADVRFSPNYLSYAMPGVVCSVRGRKGVRINFFGEGQCVFTPNEGQEEQFACHVRRSMSAGKTGGEQQ